MLPLDAHALRSHYVLMNENDGQLHTLSVLEQLREASKSLWGASSAAYFRVDELLRQLANTNLHDIPRNLPFRVEMWGSVGSASSVDDCSVGKRSDRARGHGCCDSELSGSAFHFALRDTCHTSASARLRGQSAISAYHRARRH